MIKDSLLLTDQKRLSGGQVGTTRRLDPLLLAGVVTAVAVACLLLVGLRSASAARD